MNTTPLWAICQPGPQKRVGAENPVTSRDLHILVDETAEPVASQRPSDGSGGWSGNARGRALIQRPMWAMSVVVLEVLLQYHREVALSGDQELVEAFPAERADEAFRDRVREHIWVIEVDRG